jgi:hypothetical protein
MSDAPFVWAGGVSLRRATEAHATPGYVRNVPPLSLDFLTVEQHVHDRAEHDAVEPDGNAKRPDLTTGATAKPLPAGRALNRRDASAADHCPTPGRSAADAAP